MQTQGGVKREREREGERDGERGRKREKDIDKGRESVGHGD